MSDKCFLLSKRTLARNIQIAAKIAFVVKTAFAVNIPWELRLLFERLYFSFQGCLVLYMSNYFLDRFQGAWLGSIVPLLFEQSQRSEVLSHSATVTSCERKISEIVQQQYNLLAKLRKDRFFVSQHESPTTITEFLLQLLPAIVYFHDDWSQLKTILVSQISSHSDRLNFGSEVKEDILVWSCIVGLALRGEVNLANLANLVTNKIGLAACEIKWLGILEIAFWQGFTFTELESHISSKQNKEIPLALFCFLSNQRHFSLVVNQALAMTGSEEVAVLTGAVAGAYVGWSGLPSGWRNRLRRASFFSEIKQHTENLYGEWLGLEYPVNYSDLGGVGLTNLRRVAIAAPRIAQKRAELKIISQAEYCHERPTSHLDIDRK